MRRKVMSHESVSAFCLEMALLVHAGISAEDGLYLLAEDAADAKEEKMLTEMAQVLGEAEPLSQAVRRAGVFPAYVGDMIETGEQAGRLEESLRSLSAYYDRQMQLNNEIRSVLLYPVVLMLLMLVIILVLLIKVLPVFNQVYEQLGGTMTGAAAVLLNLGDRLGTVMPVICVVLGVILALGLFIGLCPVTRGFVVSLYQQLFGSRGIGRKMSQARFCSAMAMGMKSGLNTEDAFRNAVRFQNKNKKIKRQQDACLNMLDQGESLAEAFRQNHMLSRKYCRILDLGTKSGTADTAMEEIARRMEESLDQQLQQKVGRIEPTIVILTSILVGVILMAVMLPLIHIMSSIG